MTNFGIWHESQIVPDTILNQSVVQLFIFKCYFFKSKNVFYFHMRCVGYTPFVKFLDNAIWLIYTILLGQRTKIGF